MSNVDVPQDNDSPDNEIESPVDGPTPDWMKMATSSSSKPSLTEDDMPDWLKEIQAGKTLGEGQKETPEEPPSEMSDLERLLAEEGVDLEATPEERPPGSEGMSARDWMIATSDDEMIRKRIGEESVAEETSGATAGEDPYAGLSDIERLLAEEGVDLGSVQEERPMEAEGMSARDWMISTSDDDMIRKRVGAEPIEEIPEPEPLEVEEGEEVPESILDEDLPDWLQDVGTEEPVGETDIVASDDDLFEKDLPDWLQEMPAEEEEEIPEPILEDTDEDDGMVVEEDLPDWLREMDTEEEETPQPVATTSPDEDDKMVVEEQLPDWLRDVEAEVSAAPAPAADIGDEDVEFEDEDLPDWLRDVEEEVSTGGPSVVIPAEEEDDKIVVEEDLPEWLQEVEVEEPEPAESLTTAGTEDDQMVVEEDLPDWLRDVEEEVETVAATADEDLPAWLREAEEPEAVDVEFEPEPVAEVTAVDEEMVEEDELPDWLREVQEEPSEELFEAEFVSEAEETELDEELPEWLSQVSIEEEEAFEPSEPSPEELEIFDTDEEDLPEWLKEVQTEAEEFEIEPEPVEAEVETADIIEEELPDWLREADEEPEAEPAFEAEPTAGGAGPTAEEAEVVAEAEEPVVEAEELGEVVEEPEPVMAAAEAKPEEPPTPEEEPEIVEEAAVAAPVVATTGMPDWLKKLREGDHEPEPIPVPRPAEMPAPVPEPQPVAQVKTVPEPVEEEMPAPVDLPEDADERLNLARTALDGGDLEEAVRVYDSLVTSGVHLDTVIDDIELTIRTYPSNFKLYQVMGDAMMKDGRLQSALEAYRKALEKLSL